MIRSLHLTGYGKISTIVGTIDDVEELAEIVNKSLRQTLGRSVNTVLTVIFVVVALMLLGAESIRTFSIALLIGLIAGTYSSIFISAQIWFDLKKREMKEKGAIKVDDREETMGFRRACCLIWFHNYMEQGILYVYPVHFFLMREELQ